MASSNSLPKLSNDILKQFNLIVETLNSINNTLNTNVNSISVSDGVNSYNLPSLSFLKSEIDRIDNNVKSLLSVNDNSSLVQTSNNKYKKIVTVDLNREPNDINTLLTPITFKIKKNWFFDALLDPQLFIDIDLSDKVENNVRKVLCRRYIIDFNKNADNTITPLGQSAINSFDSNFKGKNNININDLENWILSTNGVVKYSSGIKYDESMFDLELNIVQKNGRFSVLKIEEDTINRKLWYHIDKLDYINTSFINGEEFEEKSQLKIDDEIIINTPSTNTRYKIIELSSISSNPKIRLERIEGNEPIPVGIGTLKVYSSILYKKSVNISVGYNERNVIFIKPINVDNYIASKNWSNGIAFNTNDLVFDNDRTTSLERYYVENINDYGEVLNDLVVKKMSNKIGVTPNIVTLNTNNFKVVQINKHLTDSVDANSLKNKYNQQISLRSEINQIDNIINEKNKYIKNNISITDNEKKQYLTEIATLNSTKETKSSLLVTINNDITELIKSPTSKTTPKYRVRGFWDFPEPTIQKGSEPQEVIQFIIQYRYSNLNGSETPVEIFTLNNQTAAYSNWNEFKTDIRKRTYDASTNTYSWEVEKVSDADTPNINQLDIPIDFSEKVEIRIKSVSEVGYPESPLVSDFSETITIEFPTDLNNIGNDTDSILNETNIENVKNTINNDLSSKGVYEHISNQITIDNKVYHHTSSDILSEFRDSNNNTLSLLELLKSQENRIAALEAIINKAKGELEIFIYRGTEQFSISNNSEIPFTIDCENYMEKYTENNNSGRVYYNNIYAVKEFVIELKNKYTDSPLGLLSNKKYNLTNSSYYNQNSPQTIWVDSNDNLLVNNNSGKSLTQLDNQFVWLVNYDDVMDNNNTKLADDITNYINTSNVNNSLVDILSSVNYNLGVGSNNLLSFNSNNNSLLETNKWVEESPSLASNNKLLTTIHTQTPSLTTLQELNNDKIKTIRTDVIRIPIIIYFKLNSLDNSVNSNNSKFIDVSNTSQKNVTHTKKVKFYCETEDGKSISFSVKFTINRINNILKKR